MSASLAELVAQRRAALGCTMRDLASRVGVSSAYIAHLEHGRIDTPSPVVLTALARELHIHETQLLQAMGYLQVPAEPASVIEPFRSLAQLVKDAREARGLTQAQVDQAIGMSLGYIGMVESGRITRPRPTTLSSLERVLNIPREDLLVATGQLDTPRDDPAVLLQRIAALPKREQRIAAWAALPPTLRSALMVLMQDVIDMGVQHLWDRRDEAADQVYELHVLEHAR